MDYCLAGLSEARKIAELRLTSHTEDGESFKETYEEYIRRTMDFVAKGINEKSWYYWVAKKEDLILGVIAIFVFERIPAPGRLHAYNGYITNAYVRKGYRNKGIGKDLITRVKKWAEELRINVLMLYSSYEAIAFYRREGFSTNNEFFNLILDDE